MDGLVLARILIITGFQLFSFVATSKTTYPSFEAHNLTVKHQNGLKLTGS
jgi:hypothetical protein